MLPTRITLKDLIGAQLVPRRKRTSKCPRTSDLTDADSVQMRHIGTPNDTLNECVRPQPITQMIPENGLEGARTEVAFTRSPHRGVKRPQSNYVARNGRTDGVNVEGPHTRGKYGRSGPHTRSRSRSKLLQQVSRRLCLLCSICWNPAELVSKAQSIIKASEEPERKLNSRRKGSAPRAACAGPRRAARAHVSAERGVRALTSPKRSPKTYRLKLSPTKTSGIGDEVDDLATNSIHRKVKRVRTGRVRSLRAARCQPRVAAADPARVLKGKQIHLTGISNINGHGSLIYSEVTDMDTRGHAEVKEKPPNSPAGSPSDSHRENMAIQEEIGTTEASDSEPEVEELSCQRARVHLKKLYLSCARTCMPWPFSNRGPKISSSSEAHLAGLGNPSLGILEAPVSGSESTTSNVDEIKFKLSNVAADVARSCVQPAPFNEINVKRKDHRDDSVAAEKCILRENLCSLDRTVNKLDLESVCREPQKVSSKMATISSPMRQPGPNCVTRSSWLRGGCETPSSLGSTLSTPLLLSPSVSESATTSTLLISEPEDRGNLRAMPCFCPLANLNKDLPSPSSSFTSHGHEVSAADDSPCHDKENDTDSSSSTPSSTPSQNSETFSTCNSNIVTPEKAETQADIFQIYSPLDGHHLGRDVSLHSVPVEPWSMIYMDMCLPRPVLSPLSSPTKPSYTRLLPNQRSPETKVCVTSSWNFKTDLLDEITAYEHDILLVDVVQDDPDLFDNLPKQNMLKRGPALEGPPKIPPDGFWSQAGRALLEANKRVTPAPVQFYVRSVFADPIEEESDSRPWRPQRFTPSPTPSNSWPTTNPVVGPTTNPVVGPTTNPVVGPTTNPVVRPTTNPVVRPTTNPVVGQNKLDTNNNQTGDTSDRLLTIQANKPLFNSVGTKDCDNGGAQPAGQRLKIREDLGVVRRHPSTTYCKFYFSEKQSCWFNFCRFPHSPDDGDEKFCIESVLRFSKNQLCLQKASTVFIKYYQKNSPGVFFSNHVVTSLLWALLKAGLYTDILSVLNLIVAHQITPVPEFLLEFVNVVREKHITAIVPELTRITSQMSMSALPPSMDNTLLVKLGMFPPPRTTTTSNGFPESLNLAHTLVEVELCTKQKNWPRLGLVFRRLCRSGLCVLDLEQLSGRITIALLSETSGILPIPFAAFTDTVTQEGADDLMKTTLGRIGVSLMLRYYKTHQWGKGRRVLEILSSIQVAFSTLQGLFGNECAASRCSLITMASKLFLLSGSIEGALNTLRDNEWFLVSCSWPCAPDDLEERTHLLLRLAESTAHRDALEILSNLPGLKEPNESVDVSQYGAVFNAQLQACMEKQMLPVASDVVELMLCKQLEAKAGLLQTLLNKLTKQKLWHRAREIFIRALNAGYYPEVAAPRGLQSLCVPPTLGEIEMALCLEMFISTQPSSELHITLQRSHACESVYLSASNRLLSAAGVLQPRLTVHFTAVNPSQEQVFTLDMPSVRLWLQHNCSWASEVWSHLSWR